MPKSAVILSTFIWIYGPLGTQPLHLKHRDQLSTKFLTESVAKTTKFRLISLRIVSNKMSNYQGSTENLFRVQLQQIFGRLNLAEDLQLPGFVEQ